MKKIPLVLLLFSIFACNPPPQENIYRKEGRFPSNLNVPVAFLAAEWGGRLRGSGSAWLIDGGNGLFFSAKHVTDALLNNIVELGPGGCKMFLSNGKVFTCTTVKVPPLRDAVVLRLLEPFNFEEMPKPYKISETELKVGDKVFVQGLHSHPIDITESNKVDGIEDAVVPILKNFYEIREADPSRQREVVFDNIEAIVVDLNEHIQVDDYEPGSIEEIRYKVNDYVKVVTTRNHKFSFGGLSGGVVIKINEQGIPEAVGIVTAERSERWEYDEKGRLGGLMIPKIVSDTIMITPIYSVRDLYEYARKIR